MKWNRFWRFLSFRRGFERSRPTLFVEVSLKRLAVLAALLFVSAYLAGTAALAFYWGNRPHSPVTYWDVVWPGNWSSIRPKQGQMLIAQADEYLKNKKFREAYFHYQNGLRMYPEDHEARLAMAKILVSSSMLERSAELLADGLNYGYPEDKEYIGVLLQIIAHQQNQKLLAEVSPKLLQSEYIANDPERKYALLMQYMQAQMLSGDYLGVIATAESVNADPDAPYKAHEAIISAYLQMGANDQALAYLEELPTDARTQPSMQLLEAACLGDSGQTEAMMELLQSIYRQFPGHWQIQLSAIQLMFRYGQNRQASTYVELYLNTYIGEPKALNSLAVYFTDKPDSKHLSALLDSIEKRQPRLRPSMEFFLIQALTTEGNFTEAKKLYESWVKYVPDNNPEIKMIQVFGDILEAATDGGAGARETLLENLREERFPAEIYWEAALAMVRSDHKDTAMSILVIGSKYYPAHPSLQALRDHIENPEKNVLALPGSDSKLPNTNQAQESFYTSGGAGYQTGLTPQDLEDTP